MGMESLLRLLPALLILWTTSTGQQDRPQPRPEPGGILRKALAAHCGTPQKSRVKTLHFTGTVETRTPEGDVNNIALEQWFEIRKGKDTLLTRLAVPQVSGSPKMIVRGFNGKRYFVVTRNRKTLIDGNPDYRDTRKKVEEDLRRMRFVIDTFIAGNLVGKDTVLNYLKKDTAHGLDYHMIARKGTGLEDCVFFVNARKGERPYFHGIEFPARTNQSKRNFCFGKVWKFGRFHIPRDIRVHYNDSRRPDVSIWIEHLEVNGQKKPAWAGVGGK